MDEILDPSEPVVYGPHDPMFQVTVRVDHTVDVELLIPLGDDDDESECLFAMGSVLIQIGSQLMHQNATIGVADEADSDSSS